MESLLRCGINQQPLLSDPRNHSCRIFDLDGSRFVPRDDSNWQCVQLPRSFGIVERYQQQLTAALLRKLNQVSNGDIRNRAGLAAKPAAISDVLCQFAIEEPASGWRQPPAGLSVKLDIWENAFAISGTRRLRWNH